MKLAVILGRSKVVKQRGVQDDSSTTQQAARFAPPGLKDVRWVVGVLLLVGGILGTLKVIASFDDDANVWVAKHELLPGQNVSADDFVRTKARLGGSTGAYLNADKPQGVVQRHVAAGELVPQSALQANAAAEERPITLAVPRMQTESIAAGDQVEVWVAQKVDQTGVARFEKPTKLLGRALVSRTNKASAGMVSASDTRSVEILAPTAQLSELIDAVNSESRITLVPLATKGQ